jgi:CDP-glucose 4,6-dehydratase
MEVNFWKSRRVFLTGHTGFKGSWLSLWLVSMGAEVCGYGLAPTTEPSLYNALALDSDLRSTIADIRDLPSLERAMQAFAPEIVIHMAAQPLVRYSYEHPVETYEVNVVGTVHLLEAVRHTPSVRAVVSVTSDKCYENREWPWPYREDEAMGGHDPYSSSKGCAELVTAAYRRSFFNGSASPAVATARAGNVIGGGDWAPDRLVPDLVRAFTIGQPVTLRNPGAVRPWQHVLEPLSGYLTLAEHLYHGGAKFEGGWNFGPSDSDAQPVGHLVAEMARLWGEGATWNVVPEPTLHEAHLLRLDSSKARALLHWRSRWSLDEALANTVHWYREFYGKPQPAADAARECTLRQIECYTSDQESAVAVPASMISKE